MVGTFAHKIRIVCTFVKVSFRISSTQIYRPQLLLYSCTWVFSPCNR